MKLKMTRFVLSVAAAGVILGGCGGASNGSSGIPTITSVNPVSTGKLEFAVGTANLYGTASGLNVVSTYRQASGISNVLLDTPTITGPFKIPTAATAPGGLAFDPVSTLPGAPGALDSNGTITGTPQNGTQLSTFGIAGGVFTDGISPGNSNVTTTQADSYVPYSQPMYNSDAGPTVANGVPANPTFVPWGGPPAFDPDKNGMGTRDGLNNLGAGVLGEPEGFTMFEGVTVAAGSYTLSLAVPTGFNGATPTSATVTATATMASTALLPTLTSPSVTLDLKGGGTFTLPAADFSGGITEVYVQIVDLGNGTSSNCQGVRGAGFAPVYYTFVEKAAGTYTLPDTDGPNTNTTGGPSGLTPSPSICTIAQNTAAAGAAAAGDTFYVQVIGTDYDMYGATFPITTSQSPTLTGANGQADITVSLPVMATSS
jgi:hypothetical protein